MAGEGGAPRRAMPYTLPLLVNVADAARPVATRASKAQSIGALRLQLSQVPTLIISIQLGWVGAARGADFLEPADLAVEDFFVADIACVGARKCLT